LAFEEARLAFPNMTEVHFIVHLLNLFSPNLSAHHLNTQEGDDICTFFNY